MHYLCCVEAWEDVDWFANSSQVAQKGVQGCTWGAENPPKLNVTGWTETTASKPGLRETRGKVFSAGTRAVVVLVKPG